jgi:hypothetical protein
MGWLGNFEAGRWINFSAAAAIAFCLALADQWLGGSHTR